MTFIINLPAAKKCS